MNQNHQIKYIQVHSNIKILLLLYIYLDVVDLSFSDLGFHHSTQNSRTIQVFFCAGEPFSSSNRFHTVEHSWTQLKIHDNLPSWKNNSRFQNNFSRKSVLCEEEFWNDDGKYVKFCHVLASLSIHNGKKSDKSATEIEKKSKVGDHNFLYQNKTDGKQNIRNWWINQTSY